MKTDYYVYLHKTLDGEVFYVGKGRCNRAWKKFGRSERWNAASSDGYLVEMYRENLKEQEALEIENRLIKTLPGLVNARTFETVEFDGYSEHFIYDPSSPSCLTRIKGTPTTSGVGHARGQLGHCGCKLTLPCGRQQWNIGFKGRFAHINRIIWQLFNGKIPDGFVVDHIDGNSLNNKIENLRIVTKEKNARNLKKRKDNKSGVTGVRLHTDKRCRATYWKARFHDLDGKHVCKYFSVEKIGNDEAFRLACEWRAEQIRLLNEQGAGYTERHGI